MYATEILHTLSVAETSRMLSSSMITLVLKNSTTRTLETSSAKYTSRMLSTSMINFAFKKSDTKAAGKGVIDKMGKN